MEAAKAAAAVPAPSIAQDLSVLAGLLSRLLVFTVHTTLQVVSHSTHY